MMKIVLLSTLLLTAGLVLVPQASAEWCPEPLEDTFRPCQYPILPRECWYYPDTGEIVCYW